MPIRTPLAVLLGSSALLATALLGSLVGADSLTNASAAEPQPRAATPNHGGVPALYATQAESETAARRFGCHGSHRMGHHWMPCASHGEASGHGHH